MKILLAALLLTLAQAPESNRPCRRCEEWNQPQQPFRVYGNTYYVGPHGLTSVLITSPRGHILIDAALPESAAQIAANITRLGLSVTDIKLILNSHAHFDHSGGIAEMRRLSGAQVAASPWGAHVLTKSGIGKGDPQFSEVRPSPLVPRVRSLRDGETVRVGDLAVQAHFTPGHTPGGVSFTWQSCQDGVFRHMLFADSVTAISADDFHYTDSHHYPHAERDFAKSFAFLRAVPCEIVLTGHPDAAGLWTRLEQRAKGVQPDPFLTPGACRAMADSAEQFLRQRLASERRETR